MASRILEFTLYIVNGKPVSLGFLPWPFNVMTAVIYGDLVEVHEITGKTSVFSLSDITPDDLYQ